MTCDENPNRSIGRRLPQDNPEAGLSTDGKTATNPRGTDTDSHGFRASAQCEHILRTSSPHVFGGDPGI